MAGRGRKEAEASSSGGKAAYVDDRQCNVGVIKETTEVKLLSLVNKNKDDEKKKGKEVLVFGTNEGVSGAKAPEEIGMGNAGEEVEAGRMAMVDHEVLYEVQAIRKKRNYRGQLQYLIKWRHYPEKDNTWEPYDNIKYCTDIIEAFEKCLQKGKSKKASVPALTIERGINSIKQNPKRDVNSHYMREKKISNDEKGKQKCLKDEAPTDESTAPSLKAVHDQGVVEKYKEMGGASFVMQDYVRRWREKEEAKGGVGAAAIAIFLPNCQLIDIAEHGKVPLNLLPMGATAIPFESEPQGSKELISRLTGAQKRKSGRVRRFVRPDETVKKAIDAEQVNLAQDLPASDHDAAGTGTGTGSDNKVFQEEPHITEVLEPVRVIAPPSPIPGHIMPVCIIFKALRSDGTEILVSNRELRANNPSLLLDFYEENLHYTGP